MKNTPHLHFRLDESVERGSRIIGIMDELGLLEEKQ
jgi:ribosome-binding factor A